MSKFTDAVRRLVQQTPTCALLVACCLLLIANGDSVDGLKLLQVTAPSLRLSGESARLLCQYDVEGEALYSVKWYKGGREFYRYVPRDYPPVQVFPVDGVSVDKSQSDQYHVTLINLSLASSGRYKCEVSMDAPSFQTTTSIVEMNVIHLPQTGPRITLRSRNNHDATFPWMKSGIHAVSAPSLGRSINFGSLTSGHDAAKAPFPPVKQRARQQVQHFPNGSLYHYHYRPGEDDVTELNCTSGRSKPAAALEWYVNGIKVQYGEDLIEYAPFDGSGEHDQESNEKHQPFSQLLETSVLGLRWKLPSSDAMMVLNCTSAVSSVYWSWTAIVFTPEPPDLSGDDSSVSSSGSRPRTMYQGTSQHRMTSSAPRVSQSHFLFPALFAHLLSICIGRYVRYVR